MKNTLALELRNPEKAIFKLPKPFSPIKKQELISLIDAFRSGMYTEEDRTAIERLNTLVEEAAEQRIASGIVYN
jgi:hypothetical protein